MALLNPSFETPGLWPGEAAEWTLRVHVAAESIVGFGPEPLRGVEDFERWFELKIRFEKQDLVLGLFGDPAAGFEVFERDWDNDVYLWQLPSGQVQTCNFSGSGFEDMRDGWLMEPFAWDWPDVAHTPVLFTGAPEEGFEVHWQGNEHYLWDWDAVTSEPAKFNEGNTSTEDWYYVV